jgi:acyl carrier protein
MANKRPVSVWRITIRPNNSVNPPGPAPMYADQIRPILAEHARLLVPVDQLDDDSDLYAAGLTSLSTVNLMLALEEHFEVEFLDRMLGRKTFGSIRTLAEAIEELRGPAPPIAAAASAEARGAA